METIAPQPKPKRQGAYKPGPGRPRGRKNERTLAREAARKAANEVIGQALEGAFDGDAHALLVAVYKNPALDIEIRIDAAKAALKAEKPALRAVDARHSGGIEELVKMTYVVTGIDRAPNDPPADAPAAPASRAPERVEALPPAMPAPEAPRAPTPAAPRLAPPLPRGAVVGVPAERGGRREAEHDYDPFA